MTDKTKTILCKEAGLALFNQLTKAGVKLTAVGVGVSDDKQRPVIRVYLLNDVDVSRVPTTFRDFEVKTKVTGEIRPL